LAASMSVLLIVFLFRRFKRYGDYAYTNARVSAMKGRLKGEEELDSLIKANTVQNFTNLLNETDYADYIDQKETDPETIENGLKTNLAESYSKIVSIAPENVRPIYKKLSEIIEIENIKIVLTGKKAGKSQEQIEDRLLPSKYSEGVYEQALEAKDFEKALASFEDTKYWDQINEVLSQVKEEENLLPLWNSIEKKHWEKAMKTARNSSAKGSEVIREATGMKIDVINILTVLRCVAQNTAPEKIKDLHIPSYMKVEEESLMRAMEAEDVEEAIVALEGSYYGDKLSKSLNDYEKTNSLFVFEKALNEFFLTKLKTMGIQKAAGAGPLTAFFFRKRAEVKNLIVIMNGIHENLNSEEIREKLITTG